MTKEKPKGAGKTGSNFLKSSMLKTLLRKNKFTTIVDGKDRIIPEILFGTFSATKV